MMCQVLLKWIEGRIVWQGCVDRSQFKKSRLQTKEKNYGYDELPRVVQRIN